MGLRRMETANSGKCNSLKRLIAVDDQDMSAREWFARPRSLSIAQAKPVPFDKQASPPRFSLLCYPPVGQDFAPDGLVLVTVWAFRLGGATR